MKLTLNIIFLKIIISMIDSTYQFRVISKGVVDASNGTAVNNTGKILTREEILEIFENQNGSVEELEDMINKNNLSEVVVGPKEDVLQLVAKKMNETYKERGINDFFNLKNIRNYNISMTTKTLSYPKSWNRDDFPEDMLSDYDETWDKYKRLQENNNPN